MTTPTVSFRLKPEVYLRLEAIAAEAGLSPGVYLKNKLESESNEFISDLQFMKADINEILRSLESITESNSNKTNHTDQASLLLPIVLESLLILREIGQPNKVATAQKLVNKSGIQAYNSLGK